MPEKLWTALAPVENRDADPERFASSAGYLFSPQDGARAIAEIVVGGLLEPQRMQRLVVISKQQAGGLSAQAVVSALVNTGFSAKAETASQRELAAVVQTEIAERLMILAANADATPEVRSIALAGVREVLSAAKRMTDSTPALDRIEQEIGLFLQNPSQNTPKIKPSGAPAGPPV
jgi:hypothetical protein